MNLKFQIILWNNFFRFLFETQGNQLNFGITHLVGILLPLTKPATSINKIKKKIRALSCTDVCNVKKQNLKLKAIPH